jgi:hypothetical protein
MSGCTGLTSIDALRPLAVLEILDISGCTALKDLAPLKGLARLKSLTLNNIAAPADAVTLDVLKSLPSLAYLSLRDTPAAADPAWRAELKAALHACDIRFD